MKTKEALAQPEPEPVAYRYQMPVGDGHWVWNYCTYPDNKDDPCCEPLYTHPKGWVGLTDEEIIDVNLSKVKRLIDDPIVCDTDHNIIELGKAIEAKLKQKNGYAEEKNT